MTRLTRKSNTAQGSRRGPRRLAIILGVVVILFCMLAFRGRQPTSWELEWLQEITTPAISTTITDSAVEPQLDPVLAKSLLRTSGDGWKINPGPNYPNYECKWIDFESTTGKTAKFCGHSDNESVTEAIVRGKRFHHCNGLPAMWNAAAKNENSIYLEIGANIGSCVMEMLLSTDAKVIAFEPHPKNQFVMQHSVAALGQSYQDRFILVPVALGAATATDTIFAAQGNMGNSVVGKIIKDSHRQIFNATDQHTIRVERLDSIISTDADVAFVKMDAQGFECHILEGMTQGLAAKLSQDQI
jgi:FkbM family methyltransferase